MTIDQQLLDLRDLPYGVARTAATEAIARRVETEGPREHLAMALLELVEAYTFTDEGAKSFVVFAQLLRLWDESPELFDAADERNLFWEFKWIAADVPEYPQISHAQAAAFLDDMQRRFELAGHGLSSVRMSRFRWAWHVGDPEAEAARIDWVTGMRDEFEDCVACTIGQQVDFFTETGRPAEAVALGLTQEFDCNLEPARTRYAVALAALEVGDAELAARSAGDALAADDGGATDFGPARGKLFATLARGGDLDRALRVLRNEHVALLRGGSSPLFRLRFLLGVLAGLSARLDQGDMETGLRDPEWRTVADLHTWVHRESNALADLLDPRNGNRYYADAIVAALATRPSALHLPTSGQPGAVDAAPAGSAGNASIGERSVEAEVAATARSEVRVETDAAWTSGEAAFAAAEHAAGQRDYAAAARAYGRAAELCEAEGWLERAGFAHAEAAQCAALSGADPDAHRRFAAAIPRLRTGGADPEAIVAVLAAWAPVASRMSDPEMHLREVAAELDRMIAFDAGDTAEALAERQRDAWSARRATLRDTLARSIAAAPPGVAAGARISPEPTEAHRDLSVGRAIVEALLAGEEFAALGRLADAAHAFWLAGRLQRDQGDTADAIWSLESAFEGFALARQKPDRARVAGELIDLLRASGQETRAEAIVETLANG
ncbi:hypothetical protein [Leucobacter japonicus]|uniref:hypothetical protein n=1 Tax=Leucobacter japonicus TaxID=1461259 RepID=UPI0006A788A4|nr:hypothetical protein [Leucobacter japonicus]